MFDPHVYSRPEEAMAAEQPSLHETDWMPLPRMRLTCKYGIQIQMQLQYACEFVYNSALKRESNDGRIPLPLINVTCRGHACKK